MKRPDSALVMLRLVLSQPRPFFVCAVVGIVVGVLGWSLAFLLQLILDRSGEARLLHLAGLGMIVAISIRACLGIVRRYLQMTMVNAIEGERSSAFLNHMLRLEVAHYDRFGVGELYDRLKGLDSVRGAVEDRVLGAAFDTVVVLLAGAVIAWKQPLLAGLAVLGALLPAIVVACLRQSIGRSFEATQQASGRLTSGYLDTLNGIRDLRVHAGEGLMLTRLDNLLSDLHRRRLGHTIKLSVIGNGTGFLSTVTSLLILLMGARAVGLGQLSSGQLMFIFTMAGTMLGPIENLVISWLFFDSAAIALRRIDELLELPAEPRHHAQEDGIAPGDIRFENVSFSYASGTPVLKDLSFTIPQGSRVAIVGESGAGKSTLMSLLSRVRNPVEGAIWAGDRPFHSIPLDSWRSRVGVVFQSPHLFEGTIGDNVSLGRKGISEADVLRAIDQARLTDFIRSLPLGLATPVRENASQISAGERQRIALARALVRNPSLLLLDEATSNLDIATEEAIWSALLNEQNHRTTVLVTHRLANSALADLILVMGEGRILEKGSFEVLMRLRCKYYDLWQRQSGAAARAEQFTGVR